MESIKFLEANKNLQRPEGMSEEECNNLHVYSDGEQCISCWKMNLRQRFSALFFGRVWLSVHSGETQPPVWVQCKRTVFNKEYTKSLKNYGKDKI